MEDQTRSLSEVAGLMGVSERTVRRWIKGGRLKAYKPGRDYRIPEAGLQAFIEESEISPKAQAPLLPFETPTPGAEDALIAKIVEITDRYISRSDGLNLLCEHWETQLASLGENLDCRTLDEMSRIGTFVTEFFLQAAVDETVEIGVAILSVDPKGNADAVAKKARKSSAMRPALERWERLGVEINRRGVEKFGKDAAYFESVPPGQADELAPRRLEKLQRAS
jgi:excisionase family DNA binding protein